MVKQSILKNEKTANNCVGKMDYWKDLQTIKSEMRMNKEITEANQKITSTLHGHFDKFDTVAVSHKQFSAF
jgi:hypothetical protein